MSPRPDFSSSFREFFEKKGSVPITCEIVHEGGASFNQMEESTGLSSATLSKRLKDGQRLGLWDTVATREDESRSKQKYVPTDKGHQLWMLIADIGIFETYIKYQTYESEFEEDAQEFIEAVSEAEEEEKLQPDWVEPAEPRAEARETIRDLGSRSSPFDIFREVEESSSGGDDSEDRKPIELPPDDPESEFEIPPGASREEILDKLYEIGVLQVRPPQERNNDTENSGEETPNGDNTGDDAES